MSANFIIIGASRCGTQWLHDNIEMHPEIFLPTHLQEIHFFSKYYEKGWKYYESLFEQAPDNSMKGEVTPDYIYGAEAAKRIAYHLPNSKLIVSLRNPTDRLYSMYWTLKGNNAELKNYTFEQLIAEMPHLVNQGFYSDHLKSFLSNFNRDALHVIRFENIKISPDNLLKDLFNFIGVNSEYKSKYSSAKINRATYRPHTGRFKFLYYLWRACKKFKLYSIAYTIEKYNSIKTPQMNPVTRKELINIYKQKNEELSELLNMDFSNWNH